MVTPNKEVKETGTKTAPKAPKVTRVTIQCQDCGADREIATQDRFQVKRCVDCQAQHRKVMRKLYRKTQVERLKQQIENLKLELELRKK